MNSACWKIVTLFAACVCFCALLSPTVTAQSAKMPVIGSPDTATADLPVARPRTQPITMPLFHDLAFTDFAAKTFRYRPPAGPRRRWAKVILTADFSVTPGRQYDRTAQIMIGRANVYFGTTMEPSRTVGPTWHVERDVTGDLALLQTAQPGEAILGNIVNATYTGVIHGSAALLFYPPGRTTPAAETPDVVLPMPNKAGGAANVSGPNGALTETFTFPTNVVRAYLDLITESQGRDEFWYLGVPDALASQLQTFGGTAFRGAEVTVDAAPAGVAPVYPWIYTGGMNPSLWRPIPGVQTLNFVPYRVDLTPFAGVFNDGKPHTVGIHVFNGGSSFAITGTLFVYRDPKLKIVKGAVTANTLTQAPSPIVRQKIVSVSGETSGPVSVTSARQFTLAGYVLTSQGRVDTRIVQDVRFASAQQFDISPTRSVQNLQQKTTVTAVTTTRRAGQRWERRQTFAYPLTILSARLVQPDKPGSEAMTVTQGYSVTEHLSRDGVSVFSSALSNEVTSADTALFTVSGAFAGHQRQKSTQTYSYSNSRGSHYRKTVKAEKGIVTGAVCFP